MLFQVLETSENSLYLLVFFALFRIIIRVGTHRTGSNPTGAGRAVAAEGRGGVDPYLPEQIVSVGVDDNNSMRCISIERQTRIIYDDYPI